MICKNCGHEIKRRTGKWWHYRLLSLGCPKNENYRGECGYTLMECANKFLPPCQNYHTVARQCNCGCKYPRPKYSLTQKILYHVFNIHSKPL